MITWSSITFTGEELKKELESLQISIPSEIVKRRYDSEQNKYIDEFHEEYKGLVTNFFGFKVTVLKFSNYTFAFSPQMPQRLYNNFGKHSLYPIEVKSDVFVNVGNSIVNTILKQASSDLSSQVIEKNDLVLPWVVNSGYNHEKEPYTVDVFRIPFEIKADWDYINGNTVFNSYYLTSPKLVGILPEKIKLGSSKDKDVYLRKAEKEILRILGNPELFKLDDKVEAPGKKKLKLKWSIAKDIPYSLKASAKVIFGANLAGKTVYTYLRDYRAYGGESTFAWFCTIPSVGYNSEGGNNLLEGYVASEEYGDNDSFLDILLHSEKVLMSLIDTEISNYSKNTSNLEKLKGALND